MREKNGSQNPVFARLKHFTCHKLFNSLVVGVKIRLWGRGLRTPDGPMWWEAEIRFECQHWSNRHDEEVKKKKSFKAHLALKLPNRERFIKRHCDYWRAHLIERIGCPNDKRCLSKPWKKSSFFISHDFFFSIDFRPWHFCNDYACMWQTQDVKMKWLVTHTFDLLR